jgi:enterobacterial common antigen flippase
MGKSYGQILKSSALIGGSSVVSVGLSMVRTKAMALLLGPAGIGLLGVYNSICDITRTVAGMGIYNSGVRQIAEAVGSGDTRRIARTVTTLRRVALYSGALGALFLLVFCRPVARLSFGDDHRALAVALLGLAAFFGDVSAGQSALVQGLRRVSDLARMNMLGALYGTVFGILIIYFFREAGLVPALVCVAGMGILTSWWYARKIKVEAVSIPFRQIFQEASALLKLGVILMATSLMTLGVAYLIRVLVLRQLGEDAAGHYTAAYLIGGYYITFILQAMGADFYPRLTAVAHDHAECNRLVNEQMEVGLLIAGPGLLATLTFAPLVMELFYSAKFGLAVEILRWFCLGMLLKVASWPMGFILLARNEQKLFFWSELFGNLLLVGLTWTGLAVFGLNGTGMAFFVMYLAYFAGIYLIVRRLCGFHLSAANRRLGFLLVPLITIVFLSWYHLSHLLAGVLGTVAALSVGIYSLKTLCTLVPLERFPQPVRKMILALRLARPDGGPDAKSARD